VAFFGVGKIERLASDAQNVGLALGGEAGQFELFAEGYKLVHGGGPVHIRRDQQWGAALLLQEAGQLAAGGGFARAMQADQHDATGAALEFQRRISRAEQLDQLVVNNFDDLLARLDALNDLLAERFALHPLDEIAHHLEIDVRIQQGQPDLAQGVADVSFGNLAQAAQVLEGALEFAAQCIEY